MDEFKTFFEATQPGLLAELTRELGESAAVEEMLRRMCSEGTCPEDQGLGALLTGA